MFRDLAGYTTYQQAPASSLPRLPADWQWNRLAAVGRQVRETGRPDLPLLSVYLGRGVIPYNEGGARVHAPSERLDAYQVVRPGDLVLNNQQAWRGSVGVSPHHGIISPAYIVWRNTGAITAQYAEHLFPASVMVDQFVTASRGVGDIQRDLHRPSLRNVLVPLPPLDHQAAIAAYLAYANARIEKAIAAKRRLVRLLDEMDRSIDNNLAGAIDTRADSNSDIEWLGSIPPSWDAVPAKRLFVEVDRRSSTGSEGLLSLRMREGLVDANEFTETPIPSTDLVGYKIVRPGEIVMNRMRAAIGLFGVAKKEGLVSPDYSTLKVTRGVDPDFYLHLFKTDAAMAEFRRRSNGLGTGSSGFMRLYYEDFGPMSLPLPSIDEQRMVVRTIRRQRSETMPLRSRAQREVALLQEFRNRLVADVVTGQIDVRAIAASLPSTPEPGDDLGALTDDNLQELPREARIEHAASQ
ncbi:restriction endonuclease subunit S [Microbacterium maritypicum]